MIITRRRFVALGAGIGSAALAQPPFQTTAGFAQSASDTNSAEPWAEALIRAAEAQIGVTVRYDPAYRRLAFPGGDIDRTAGVCTDVIIRAYRDAFGFDLQEAVNRDMRRAFSAYPKAWGLNRPDRNIDHRRVLNLERFFLRAAADLPKPARPADYRPGDVVTQRVGSLQKTLPHIAIIADRLSADGSRPLVVHNIGAGTRVEDTLDTYPVVYRFRFKPA